MDQVNVISLGAGVQSTTLLLMAANGQFDEKVNYAVFSDTGWEPQAVYDHLEWLKKEVESISDIKVVITSKGNIREDILQACKDGSKFASIPFFIKNRNGSGGMVRRQCTREYKITPVEKKIRELLGYKPRQRVKEQVNLWLGISTDEIQRVRTNQTKWIKNNYPLIDKWMNRLDCMNWLQRNGYPVPPKSSCIGCPFHDNHMWRDMKLNDPKSWNEAVFIDREIKKLPRFKGEAYLHPSMKPLDEVYLQEDQLELDLWGNECTGYCGT